MKGNVLILSCRNGHVPAVAFHGEAPGCRWNSAEPFEDFGKFGGLWSLRPGRETE